MAWSDITHVLAETLHALYGSAAAVDIVATTAKALVIYSFTLILVRSAKSRMLGRSTLFDIVLVFVLGSMLSRAINGSADPLPTAVAAVVLVFVHAVLGILSWHSHGVGKIVKGDFAVLVREGQVDERQMHKHHVSHHDLEEALHQNGLSNMDDVKVARLERDGRISIVPRFRVLEVEVHEGVQRIRIEV